MCRIHLTEILMVVQLILCSSLVLCKRTYIQDSGERDLEREYIRKIFGAITRSEENIPFNGRKHDRSNDNIRYFYKSLSNTVNVEQFKNWLRQEAAGYNEEAPAMDAKDELAALVEDELINALAKKSSAILDKPYVQKKGRNDFLVIRSDSSDPFVTVVPNDIYYNVEKKCVNWLDDCNQKGLRDRLLQKIHVPYK
ncbi:uncharacterized protein LOC120636038 [Pararge aegeria]|uniref:uncharacterized protein LOC120636038 n=1 Tax=Pararge aegeria TaxID=116150 RepID=UPI0019D0EE4E|nr:uncharacterized protein LOC120636038 [Pararge aegeria]